MRHLPIATASPAAPRERAPADGTFVVYRGPSALNGEPIVGIVTGLGRGSANTKTGPMAQLWILAGAEAPHLAQQSGADAAVCGSCPLRPAAEGPVRCYVRTFQGPRATWERHAHGVPVDLAGAAAALAETASQLRLGAYGDPAALPRAVVVALATAATAVVGYTHQWRRRPFSWLRRHAMASVETAAEGRAARAKGWRTYRVLTDKADVGDAAEILCPHETRGIQCSSCRLCGGAGEHPVKSIAIHSH